MRFYVPKNATIYFAYKNATAIKDPYFREAAEVMVEIKEANSQLCELDQKQKVLEYFENLIHRATIDSLWNYIHGRR